MISIETHCPASLVYVAQRWYLAARDGDRDDWRTFRVGRIRDAVRTGHTFDMDEMLDAATRASP